MTYVLMLVFVAIYAAVVLIGMKYQPEKENFFGIEDTTALRGIFCILVIIVHVPEGYRNLIQDMMGSFAYIGVTFFFMASAYGLKWGITHKKDYLHYFWFKRLPAILIPSILSWIVCVVISRPLDFPISRLHYVPLHDWVRILLLFYFVFWLFYWLPDKIERAGKLLTISVFLKRHQDMLICLIIIAMSLTDKLTPVKVTKIWPTESVGFAYGILLANNYDRYKQWTNRRWWIKCVVLLDLGLILGVAYLAFKPVWFWGDYCLKIILGIVLLMLVLQLVRRVTLKNKAIVFLGGISYEIFLLHDPLYSILESAGWIKNSGLFIWSAFLITLVLATVVKRITTLLLKSIGKGRK